jgi:hypothetical protein
MGKDLKGCSRSLYEYPGISLVGKSEFPKDLVEGQVPLVVECKS